MKTRHTCLIFFFLCLTGMLCAQDTIFVMKQGKVQYFRALSDIDSISFVNTLDVRRSIVEKVALEPRFSLFYEALSATGMVDSINQIWTFGIRMLISATCPIRPIAAFPVPE